MDLRKMKRKYRGGTIEGSGVIDCKNGGTTEC